jgi:hypothetical protein
MAMKANGGKKSVKKTAKKKGKLEEWFINILAIVLLGGGLVFIVFMTTQSSGTHIDEKDQYIASLPPQTDTITHSKICMVDDIYQGDYPTLSVRLSTSTYYGCDAKAVHELTSKEAVRFATDPVTKRKVNKASAVVGLDRKRDGKVLYFESNETFNKYSNTTIN